MSTGEVGSTSSPQAFLNMSQLPRNGDEDVPQAVLSLGPPLQNNEETRVSCLCAQLFQNGRVDSTETKYRDISLPTNEELNAQYKKLKEILNIQGRDILYNVTSNILTVKEQICISGVERNVYVSYDLFKCDDIKRCCNSPSASADDLEEKKAELEDVHSKIKSYLGEDMRPYCESSSVSLLPLHTMYPVFMHLNNPFKKYLLDAKNGKKTPLEPAQKEALIKSQKMRLLLECILLCHNQTLAKKKDEISKLKEKEKSSMLDEEEKRTKAQLEREIISIEEMKGECQNAFPILIPLLWILYIPSITSNEEDQNGQLVSKLKKGVELLRMPDKRMEGGQDSMWALANGISTIAEQVCEQSKEERYWPFRKKLPISEEDKKKYATLVASLTFDLAANLSCDTSSSRQQPLRQDKQVFLQNEGEFCSYRPPSMMIKLLHLIIQDGEEEGCVQEEGGPCSEILQQSVQLFNRAKGALENMVYDKLETVRDGLKLDDMSSSSLFQTVKEYMRNHSGG